MDMTSQDYIAVVETHPHSARPLTVGCVGTLGACQAYTERLAYAPLGVPSDGRLHWVEPIAGRRSSMGAQLFAGDRVTRMSRRETR